MDNVISVENISKSFSGHSVLENINLQVKDGEFITFLGPSGCGKTTLLRLIAGFEQPDTGSIYLNQENITTIPPERRPINMVFQSYALFPHMTVFDNIAFGLRCKKIAKSEITDRVNNALAKIKMSEHANKKPQQLSGGQQQRVAIARAAVNEPNVLLLDEPLSALDYNLRKSMRVELKELQQRIGITFIFVTHDQEEALTLSDRIVVMDHGRIVQIGSPRDIYEEPINLFAAKFIGETNIFSSTITKVEEFYFYAKIEGVDFRFNNTLHYKAGSEINVILRPEDINVWDKTEVTDTSHMFPGKVEQVIYKGSTVDLIVLLDSGRKISATEFFNEDDEDLAYTIGERVWIDWHHGWEVILPYEAV